MVNVENRSTLRLLSGRFMRMNRTRNLIAILAIVLTALLFTSLFTGASAMLRSKMDADMKVYHSYSHAFIQRLTPKESLCAADALQSSPAVSKYGTGIFLGVVMDSRFSFQTEVRYGDQAMAESFNSVPSVGTLPEAENEIALSTVILDTLGLPRTLGTTVTLPIDIDPGASGPSSCTFTLSGYWDGDKIDNIQYAWVSKSFAEKNAHPVTREEISGGIFNGVRDCAVWYRTIWNIEKKTAALSEAPGLSETAGFQINPAYRYLYAEDGFSWSAVLAILLIILLAGYLIIYNIFNISVKNDIRAYGLLKNVGASGKQLKKLVRMQALRLSAVGIPLGLLLGYGAGVILAPALTASLERNASAAYAPPSANPLVFAASALFALLTVYLSSMQACRIVERVSPVEALRMSQSTQTHKKVKRNFSVSWWGMALQNLLGNWRKGLIVMFSIAISLVTLNCIFILVQGYDFESYSSIYLSADFSLDKLSSSADYANFRGITPEVRRTLDVCPYSENTGYVYYSREQHKMDPHLLDVWEGITGQYLDSWGKYWKDLWAENVASNEITVHCFGLSQLAFEQLSWKDTPCSWEDFRSGKYVIVDYSRRTGDSYYQPGDSLIMEYQSGKTKEYQVLGEAMPDYPLDYPYASLIAIRIFLPDSEFIACTGNDSAMKAILNAISGQEKRVQQYIEDTILSHDSLMNLTSILDLRAAFDRFVNKYYMIGGCLAVVLAFIGIMNFFNTTATSILSRKNELSLLEAVGMTKKQLRKMLAAEGCVYLLGAVGIAVLLTWFCGKQLLARVLVQAFFFRVHLTVLPCLLMIPVLLFIAYAIPGYPFKRLNNTSLVERLRRE